MFQAKRGKIHFECIDTALNETWVHEDNYNIYLAEESFMLAHINSITGNKLILGLKREHVSSKMTAFSLLFLRYEFGNVPSKTPILHLAADGTPLSLHNTPFSQSSPLFQEVSPFFVPNENSPVFKQSLLVLYLAIY